MPEDKRLIEVDFPLEQTSLDSVHEKNVRHGHISTLHIWPARRPLAASRAALIATLLPNPDNEAERKSIYRRLAGTVKEKLEQKKVGGRTVENRKRETEGGILHWGRENSSDIDWFRQKIRAEYGGRAPKVLDPFAGGGAIPLEAMRLGCEVTAIDINPVAWFILKCTLEYSQKLAGQMLPLPEFALKDRDFVEMFLKAKGFKGAGLERQLAKLGLDKDGKEPDPELIAHNSLFEADLGWQVRAWGRWVLEQARKMLAHRYPTYAEFQALKPGGKSFEARPLQLLESDENGKVDAESLNRSFPKSYLDDPRNPRWVIKSTVAYLWAHTVRCKGCRATIPLFKTRWLAKKDNKRVLLTMTPNADRTGVVFAVENNVPIVGGNAAQRREHDKRRGAGTMSRSGAQCPCCPTIMSMKDIRFESRAKRLGDALMCAVVNGSKGKEYRIPTEHEADCASLDPQEVLSSFEEVPHSIPNEQTPQPAGSKFNSSSLRIYGLDEWKDVFTKRQLVSLATFVRILRQTPSKLINSGVPHEWVEPISSLLICGFDRMLDFNATLVSWITSVEAIGHTFVRYALPFTWDYSEAAPLNAVRGGYEMCVDAVSEALTTAIGAANNLASKPTIINCSILASEDIGKFDVIITDPPYYDAISYADIMDYFYVWLRRNVEGVFGSDFSHPFSGTLSPKWSPDTNDGELINNPTLFSGDRAKSKESYENGMARAFERCRNLLDDNGRFVVVFANKSQTAWETLVSSIIRAGFVVDGSWPIRTEQAARMRAQFSSALASSVWIVCKKRLPSRPGWDTAVLADMRERIYRQLRAFWDAGIRGPDFVWAATGPALEAFSKYPVVKKADEPNAQMTVSEFLREVRRIVVDFVVGRVLTHNEETEVVSRLDDITTYYLLHRNDFDLDDAPIGACILYALSCNVSDGDLADRFDVLTRTGGTLLDEMEEADEDEQVEDNADADGGVGGKGNKVKLKAWNQRKAKWLGYEGPGGRPIPLIDQAHRLMHLWRAGDEAKVDDYLETRGLKRNALFAQLLQALIELAESGSDERAILESLSNHIAARGGAYI